MKSPNILLSIVAAVTMTFGVSTSSVQGQGSCGGADTNGDGLVNGVDLAVVLGAWGVCPGTITSVTPLQGSILGGTQITINGTNLTGTTAVKIGGVACTNLQVLSPTLVKAVTPAGAAGEVPISVVTPAGTLLAPIPFTYVQLSIASVSPNQGIFSGGTAITITGSFLNGASSVKVGGVPATDVVAVNSTTVTAVTPAGSIGPASVEVTGAKGTATASGAFTYISIVVPAWATLLEATPDASVVTDANLRAAIVASGFAWRVRDNASNIEMLLVPGGTFMMGCSPGDAECGSDESPAHQVTLTNAFYMGKTEVTQAQWTAKMGNNPSYFSGQPNNPVEQVSWDTIQSFNSATGLRLPTEAEWEFACRAGTTTARYGEVNAIAWYNGNAGGTTHAVAGKLPNALGLYDTLGNVWEWCQDWYGPYSSASVTNPTGPATGSYRLFRGGGWFDYSYSCRASHRFNDGSPDNVYFNVGFRAVRAPYETATLTEVSPAFGPSEGGTAITLTGTYLTGTSSVTIGGALCTNVQVVNTTTVTAVVPAGTEGAQDIVATCNKGTATLVGGFTYIAPPQVPAWATLLEATPDASVVTDANLRAAIIATGLPWRVRDTGTGIEMLLMPAGTFTMGCSPGDAECGSNESPAHEVTLTNAFYMGKTEVTQAQWQGVMGSNPSYFQGQADSPSRPVEQVSWNMIASGSTSFMSLTGLRLPTEAEWEYAYRAGTTTAFHSYPGQPTGFSDDTLLGNIAWYNCNNGCDTKPVGGKFANALGLHDMSGNVWEWCQDWYGPYSSASVTNPTGPATGSYPLLRGGSWPDISYLCRASKRYVSTPGLDKDVGFRVARTP